MTKSFWYNGALIAPRTNGFDVILSKQLWIHRDSLRKAKWVSTVYRNLLNRTFESEFNSNYQNSTVSNNVISTRDNEGARSQSQQIQ